MKKQIRSPTSRNARMRHVLAFVSIFLCFLFLCVSTSAGEVVNGEVALNGLPSQKLPDNLYGSTISNYFSGLAGYFSYCNPENWLSSTSPDYTTGTGYVTPVSTFYSTLSTEEHVRSYISTTISTGSDLTRVNYCSFIVPINTTYEVYSKGYTSTPSVIEYRGVDKKLICCFVAEKSSVSALEFALGLDFPAGTPATDVLFVNALASSNIELSSFSIAQDNCINASRTYFNHVTGGGEGKMTALLTEIIQLLFGGLTGAATALGGGANTFVTSLFVGENNTLAIYGGLVVIFAGVALAIGFTTRIFTWITSLGN